MHAFFFSLLFLSPGLVITVNPSSHLTPDILLGFFFFFKKKNIFSFSLPEILIFDSLGMFQPFFSFDYYYSSKAPSGLTHGAAD